jgi:hypothetical protein
MVRLLPARPPARLCASQERLAGALCAHLGLADRKASQLKREEREALVAALTAWPLHVDGHEGYKKAEVRGLQAGLGGAQAGVPLGLCSLRAVAVWAGH